MANVASDALFVLIKSLSKSEKRYFSMQPLSEDGQHRVLFEAIDKLNRYDEAKLLKALKGTGIEDSLSIAKNRLYHTLLRSLSAFHAKATPEAELNRLIQSVEILYRRGLYDQAEKQIHSAKKIAQKNELFDWLMVLSAWEEKAVEQLSLAHSEKYERLKGIAHERTEWAEEIRLIHTVSAVKWEALSSYYENGPARDEASLKQWNEELERVEATTPTSFEGKMKKKQVQAAMSAAMGDWKSANYFSTKLVQLFQEFPAFTEQRPSDYNAALANKAVLAARVNNTQESHAALNELETRSQDNDAAFTLYCSTALTSMLMMREYKEAYEAVQKHKELLETELADFNLRKAHVWFQCGVLAFIHQEYKEAERWVNRIIQETPSNEWLHLQCVAQVFYLVIQIELKNERFIPYALRNVQRFLQTRNKAFEGERKILQFINETLKKRKSIPEDELWEWLMNEMSDVRKSDPQFFNYFDFYLWAKARAERIPMMKLLVA